MSAASRPPAPARPESRRASRRVTGGQRWPGHRNRCGSGDSAGCAPPRSAAIAGLSRRSDGETRPPARHPDLAPQRAPSAHRAAAGSSRLPEEVLERSRKRLRLVENGHDDGDHHWMVASSSDGGTAMAFSMAGAVTCPTSRAEGEPEKRNFKEEPIP